MLFTHLENRLHVALQLVEMGLNLGVGTAVLIDIVDTPFNVDIVGNSAENLVGGAKHPFKQLELVVQQLEHSLIGGVLAVNEVDHHHIVLLPVTVHTANALLDLLRAPR